ncbi:hypothetical protein B0H19DRAFT_1071566 [Mycena capillaripes]|nr:hypothetical protein B0H19DRAFT_1071566 [Mycena capillaripes]
MLYAAPRSVEALRLELKNLDQRMVGAGQDGDREKTNLEQILVAWDERRERRGYHGSCGRRRTVGGGIAQQLTKSLRWMLYTAPESVETVRLELMELDQRMVGAGRDGVREKTDLEQILAPQDRRGERMEYHGSSCGCGIVGTTSKNIKKSAKLKILIVSSVWRGRERTATYQKLEMDVIHCPRECGDAEIRVDGAERQYGENDARAGHWRKTDLEPCLAAQNGCAERWHRFGGLRMTIETSEQRLRPALSDLHSGQVKSMSEDHTLLPEEWCLEAQD